MGLLIPYAANIQHVPPRIESLPIKLNSSAIWILMKNHINALIPNANANAIPTASHVKTTSKFILIPVIRGRGRGRGRELGNPPGS